MGERRAWTLAILALVVSLLMSTAVDMWTVHQKWEQLAESRQQAEMYQKIVADIRELSK